MNSRMDLCNLEFPKCNHKAVVMEKNILIRISQKIVGPKWFYFIFIVISNIAEDAIY